VAKVSTEILQPFQLTSSGSVATTTDPGVQAQQHVSTLVATKPGERVMLPTYGINLAGLVFAPNDPAVIQTISQDVTNAVNTWEPSLTVQSVTPTPGQDPTQGQAMVNVDYSIASSAGQPGTSIQTATVLVGGDVISDGA
jgi:uncharacterized protein